MRKLLLGLLVGLLLGWMLNPPPVVAQAAQRIFGTTAAGAPIPIRATDAGLLRVACQ